jgi:hypothetical protein
VQATCEVGVVDFELTEQPSDDTVMKKEQQEQQHKEEESDFGSEPMLGSQSATVRLVVWLMAPLTWMAARFQHVLIGVELELVPVRIDM